MPSLISALMSSRIRRIVPLILAFCAGVLFAHLGKITGKQRAGEQDPTARPLPVQATPAAPATSYPILCLKAFRDEVDWALRNVPQDAPAETTMRFKQRFHQSLDRITAILGDQSMDIDSRLTPRPQDDARMTMLGSLGSARIGLDFSTGPSSLPAPAHQTWETLRTRLDEIVATPERYIQPR